jgi:membrane-bound lytic murein transglycosylase A
MSHMVCNGDAGAGRRVWRLGAGWAVILGIAAGCTSTPTAPPAGSTPRERPAAAPSLPSLPTLAGEAVALDPALTPAIARARSRWVAVPWSDLPGWESDRLTDWWPAFVAGCARPAPGWSMLCAEALLRPPPADDAALRAWLQERLAPWRVESPAGESATGAAPASASPPAPSGGATGADAATGLLTGYLEPVITARRRPNAEFRTALYAAPADLAQRRPYWTRQEIDTQPAARAALRGREIAYVADPLDALFIQIQGSTRLLVQDERGSTVRLAFAGHNDQPYRSVGRWLIEQGELRAGEASWPAIKAWAQRNPRRVPELLWSNPRVVFFREEPLPDPAQGPRGAQGVPLTPQRSIAVDPLSVPYGTPVWLDSTEPLAATPLRRLTMAQDTGSAITGAVRADYFWGWGDEAEAQAGRMRQPLRKWVLWPRP